MTELCAKNVTVRIGRATLVEAASFSLRSGELVALLGPNGAGKTTLLRATLGLGRLSAGSATLDDEATARLSSMERARRVGYLPQVRPLAWPNTVRDVVALGRFAYGAALGRLRAGDAEAVDRAVAACDLADLVHRRTDTLSGGELARVHCARAFAAEAPLLIADEPTAALDLRHQFQVMELLRRFVDTGGGVLVVLHDVGLAVRFADRLIWMKDGSILADGSPEETLTADRIRAVYGMHARVEQQDTEWSVQIEGVA